MLTIQKSLELFFWIPFYITDILLQNWLAFSKLHKPLFTEHGSVKFPNTNPPTDENNNAYCEVSLKLHSKLTTDVRNSESWFCL